MIEKGFEYAYMYGEPKNADTKRYRITPKCCKVCLQKYPTQSFNLSPGNLSPLHLPQVDYGGDSRGYRCAHKWEPKFELPIGDPITGREWIKPRPDTGTYQGGTFPKDW